MVYEFTQELLAPVYDFMGASKPLIIGFFVILICAYFISKIRSRIRAKQSHKFKVGTTNDWFKWDQYYEYLAEINKTPKPHK